jgi:hypothetical protein
VHFFTIKVYILEIYVKFCVFWYPWSPYCEKKNLRSTFVEIVKTSQKSTHPSAGGGGVLALFIL